MEDEMTVLRRTQEWMERFVIGLNICPFARAPYENQLIKYSIVSTSDLAAGMSQIENELDILFRYPHGAIETTLVIFPAVHIDFRRFNAFNAYVEDLIAIKKWEDLFQSVVFHPQFRFAGLDTQDIANSVNQSPYPMIHLLRQKSIAAVSDDIISQRITAANEEKLNNMGKTQLKSILKGSEEE